MKKKLVTLMLAFALCVSFIPSAAVEKVKAADVTTGEVNGDVIDEDDEDSSGEFTKYDLSVLPAKKTVSVGKSFTIRIVPTDESEWADIPDEEWDEICEENIDSIEFRSTKSSIASVNKVTGKVKAKKKGTAVIKTTINLVNGESVTFRTKVYVTK